MEDFLFDCRTRIIFGKNAHQGTGSECKRIAERVLLLYGGGSVRKNGVLDKVKKSLEDAGVSFCELCGVKSNPLVSLVREGVYLAKRENVKLILAVGGGSVIDTAKAIALGACYAGDVWDFYTQKSVPCKSLAVGCVLTIPAAGSESSVFSVISDENTKQKLNLYCELSKPEFAILNPQFTYTLPSYQTACGGVDIMAHMMERYFVDTAGCSFTDRLIEGGVRSMLECLPEALTHPDDYDTRAQIMWIGNLAHNGLMETGRGGGDWAVHDMELELSALFDIAHGAGLAVIYPAWMKYVSKKRPQKLLQFARKVFDINCNDEGEAVRRMIERLEKFYRDLGLKTHLSELGIGKEKIEFMSQRALTDCCRSSLGRYVTLDKDDIAAIYTLAL